MGHINATCVLSRVHSGRGCIMSCPPDPVASCGCPPHKHSRNFINLIGPHMTWTNYLTFNDVCNEHAWI